MCIRDSLNQSNELYKDSMKVREKSKLLFLATGLCIGVGVGYVARNKIAECIDLSKSYNFSGLKDCLAESYVLYMFLSKFKM